MIRINLATEKLTGNFEYLVLIKAPGTKIIMPRNVQLQVFQRSFSTKGPGRGIGTYSMKLFAEQYLKGKIWFTTEKSTGTTFYFSIPLKTENPE